MVHRSELTGYLNELLETGKFADYAPNGLQVEGREEIRVLVSAVTASRAAIESAIARGADALLVHHGYFWKGEPLCITGMKRQRLNLLLRHDINLLAYHLPLDAHAVYGNNSQFARVLGIRVRGVFGAGGMGLYGELDTPLSAAEFASHVSRALGRVPLHIAGDAERLRAVGWVTGAAQGYIEEAAAFGLDAYISGEISEQTVHAARETGIHFFSAGHHATERYGVMALGGHLADKFALAHEFADIDNPV